MNLKNWREGIIKVYKQHMSLCIVIPYVIGNDMGLDENSYLEAVYDDKRGELILKKKVV